MRLCQSRASRTARSSIFHRTKNVSFSHSLRTIHKADTRCAHSACDQFVIDLQAWTASTLEACGQSTEVAASFNAILSNLAVNFTATWNANSWADGVCNVRPMSTRQCLCLREICVRLWQQYISSAFNSISWYVSRLFIRATNNYWISALFASGPEGIWREMDDAGAKIAQNGSNSLDRTPNWPRRRERRDRWSHMQRSSSTSTRV